MLPADRPRLPLALGAAAGALLYLVLWVTVALAYEQDPALLRVRDLGPFLSGGAAFAAAGLLLGALARAGRVVTVAGAAAGALLGYAAAAWHVLHPYALPVSVPAVALLAAGSAAGGLAGLAWDAVRGRRRAAAEAGASRARL